LILMFWVRIFWHWFTWCADCSSCS